MSAFKAEGTHLLADLSGVAAHLLTSCSAIEILLRAAAEAAGARVLHSHFHTFGPGLGVTGVVVLAESHISIHTWPEQQFAAADIFMCGNAAPRRALDILNKTLMPQRCDVKTVYRSADSMQTAE